MPVILDATTADFEAQFSALLGAKREDSQMSMKPWPGSLQMCARAAMRP